jgi:hypothetical protein
MSLIASLCFSCARSNSAIPVEFERDIQAPALLVSEILEAPDKSQLVRCATSLKNPGRQEVQLELLSTGCACYGLTVDGKKLLPGEKTLVPAGADVSLKIAAQPPDAQTVKSYTADLQVIHPGTLGTQLLSLTCELTVYQDVRIAPNVITFEFADEEAGPWMRNVVIEAVARGRFDEAIQPTVTGLPEFVSIRNLVPLGSEEPLENDLRRKSWTAELVLERVPGKFSELKTPLPFHVVVQASKSRPERETLGHLVLQVRRPIAFPARVFMGKMKPSEVRQRRILLTSTDGQPFTLQLESATLPKFLHVSLDAGAQRQHWIELAVTPQGPGEFSGEFSLKTDRPTQPSLEITVTGDAETSSAE